MWDLYTASKIKTGKIHVRGDKIPKDRYHLVVHVWIKNSHGQYLIFQRSEARHMNSLKYECVGGSALKGEMSIDAAIRETKEETGKVVYSEVRKIANGIVFNDILDDSTRNL